MNFHQTLWNNGIPTDAMQPIPSSYDYRMRDMMLSLSAKKDEEFPVLANNLSYRDRVQLDGVAQTFASWAVRTQDSQLVKLGLFCIDLADYGATIPVCESMPILFDALQRMGADGRDAFRSWAPDFSGVTRERIDQIIRRGRVSLDESRFCATMDTGAFRYVAVK